MFSFKPHLATFPSWIDSFSSLVYTSLSLKFTHLHGIKKDKKFVMYCIGRCGGLY